MPRGSGPGSHAESFVVSEILREAGCWLLLVSVVDVGAGLLSGSCVWWLGWTRPPIKDFFVALAGIGGALLIAYSVTFSQVLPVLGRNAVRADGAGASLRRFRRIVGSALGVAAAAVVGIGACLALVRDPLEHVHWWAMGLFGVSVLTLGALGLAIGLGTALYVFLFFEE